MWNRGWDNIFKKNKWGKYPDMSVIRFIANGYKKKDKKKLKILEVGCGTGANLSFFIEEGFNTYGIDGSKVAIKLAKKKLKKEKKNSKLFVGDIQNMPFRSNYFDCIVDCECIYSNSFSDSKIILKEIKRILKRKGSFFSKTFANGTYGDNNGVKLNGERNSYLKIKKGSFHKGYGLIRLSSLRDIKDLYGKFFKIQKIEYEYRTILNMKKKIKEWLISMTSN